jgi:hypothetical protein
MYFSGPLTVPPHITWVYFEKRTSIMDEAEFLPNVSYRKWTFSFSELESVPHCLNTVAVPTIEASSRTS